jgi:hypothetical protein
VTRHLITCTCVYVHVCTTTHIHIRAHMRLHAPTQFFRQAANITNDVGPDGHALVGMSPPSPHLPNMPPVPPPALAHNIQVWCVCVFVRVCEFFWMSVLLLINISLGVMCMLVQRERACAHNNRFVFCTYDKGLSRFDAHISVIKACPHLRWLAITSV